MKKLLLTTTMIMSVATGANASIGSNHHNDYSQYDNSVNAFGGNGGAGGNAKSNSNATGVGIAGALSGSESSVNKSGNSDNNIRVYGDDNINKNRNNLNQNQDQTLKNNNDLANNANNSSSNVNEGNDVSIVENHNYRRIPANTAYAPDLTSGIDTCLGSTSFGGSAITGSLTFGTTKVDTNCVKLKQAKFFKSMHMNDTAVALFCDDVNVARALRATGYNTCDYVEIEQQVTYNAKSSCEYPTSAGCGRIGGRR